MTRIYFVAGESSGDLHGANLILALRELDPNVVCEGLGGTRMAAAGMHLHEDLAGLGIMGFAEVLKSLGGLRRLFWQTVEHLRQNRPDCLVLIDYPGFNIRLARQAHNLGIRVVYYISPQVWAWKKGRIQTLARIVDKMLVILPFEEPLYAEAGLPCRFVGHPLLDYISSFPIEGHYEGGQVVGLLPGSRAQEIRRILPVMLDVARGLRTQFSDTRFIAPCVDARREAQIRAMSDGFPIETAIGGAYEVLSAARFCMVASGTATVEAMYYGVPMIVLYKVLPVTYWLARLLVRIEHIAMVNILAQRRVVPEFIQGDAKAFRILPAAIELMEDTPRRREMIKTLREARHQLGDIGASRRAAEEVLRTVKGTGNG